MTIPPIQPNRPRSAGAAQAILAIARLMAAGGGGADLQRVRDSLVEESRGIVGVRYAALLAPEEGGEKVVAVAGDAHGECHTSECPGLERLLFQGLQFVHVQDAIEASSLGRTLIVNAAPSSALLLRVSLLSEDHILVLADPHPEAFSESAIDAVMALVAAGTDAIARGRAADADARRAATQSALTRAAKTLNASLDLETVLSRICQEAARILDGDHASVYRGSHDGLVMEASYGLAPELAGFKLRPGQGLAGKVFHSGVPMLSNEFRRISGLPPDSPFARVHSCMAVPMRWGGNLRGVIAVGYARPFQAGPEQLTALETFAELAAVACTNASAHAGLALAARTDGLTGCLNHAALHESLQREIGRTERSGDHPMSLIMFDLDDFKSVNEVHGHLVGDEVLRRAGSALREVTRPYDFAARYGGDEFAILCVETSEEEAQEIARRAVERVSLAIRELCPDDAGQATGGVAEWSQGLAPTELVARADRALLFGKHEGGRGSVIAASDVPAWFRPGRFASSPESGRAHGKSLEALDRAPSPDAAHLTL